MRDAELRELLHRAGDEVPEPDVAVSTWSRGRVARRRRWTLQCLGGLVAATVVGALGVQVAGWSDGGPLSPAQVAGETGDGAVQRLEPPSSVLVMSPLQDPQLLAVDERRTREDAADAARESAEAAETRAQGRMQEGAAALAGSTLLDRTQQVWADVQAGCLESRGYLVSRDGPALSVTLPEGKKGGDYSRDTRACRAELLTDAPVSVIPLEPVVGQARVALTERYFQYYWAQGCLVDAGLPTVPVMPAEEFIAGLGWAQLPPWHPYEESARQGRYAEAREACPIQPSS